MTQQEKELRDAVEKHANTYDFWEALSEEEVLENIVKISMSKEGGTLCKISFWN